MSYRRNRHPQNAVATAPPGAGGCVGSRVDCAESPDFPQPGGRASAGVKPPLDNTAKSVGRSDDDFAAKQGRILNFRHQRHAAGLLGGTARVGLCRWSVISRHAGVDVVMSRYGDAAGVSAHFEGLQTCGSVWDCPCCSARISETRRGEMNGLLAWARSEGFTVQMITLTARHGRRDALAALLDGMKRAKQRWGQHRAYKRLKALIVGSVTATEVTGGGAHGWHPHFHMIVVTVGPADLDALRDAWLSSLRWAGLDGTGAGWRVQDASAAGRYVTKWGAAEEMTMGDRKRGRGGRTPRQLLAASCDDGDVRAGMLWREYSAAFRGRRQLVWSRGLKARAGIGEVEDDEAARDERQDRQAEVGRAHIEAEDWSPRDRARRGAQHRRGRVLDAAEAEGPEGVARVVAGGGTDAAADHADLIEPDLMPLHRPAPGGLGARALALMRGPP